MPASTKSVCSTLVEPVGDTPQHGPLAGAILVGGMGRRQGTGRPQQRLQGIDIERRDHPRLRWLHHHVQALGLVVRDRRPEPFLEESSGNGQIGVRGRQLTRGVIVDHQAPLLCAPSDGQDSLGVATGDGPGLDDPAFGGHRSQETNLTTACLGDLARDDLRGFRTQTKRGLGQVFSVFFLAAGNSTLLRISR